MSIQSRSLSLKSLFIFFLLVSNAAAAIRLYIRCRIARKFGADDIFLCATMICFTLYSISSLFSVRYGIGSVLIQEDNKATLSAALEWWFLADLFTVLSASLLRISASLHMRKIAEKSIQQRMILIVGTVTTLYSACFFLLQLFQCTPIHFFWTGWLGAQGRCMDQQRLAKMEYTYTMIGAVIDWSLALVPLWLLWNTELSRKTRSRIRTLMMIGVCAGTAAFIRLPATQLLPSSDDFFFDCVPVAVSSILEIGLGMIAISAAAYRPILPGFLPVSPSVRTVKPSSPLPEEFKTPTKQTRRASMYGDLSESTSEVQMTPRSASFRRLSDAKSRYYV